MGKKNLNIDQEFAEDFVNKLSCKPPIPKLAGNETPKVMKEQQKPAPKRESDRKRPGKDDEKGGSKTILDAVKEKKPRRA